MPVAVLFDVDLTLLDARRSGSKALACAFEEIWGWEDALGGVSLAGRTDLAIVSGVIAARMTPKPRPDEITAHVGRLRDVYLSLLEAQLVETPAVPCPGIPGLLDRVEGVAGMAPGLATGNFRAGAMSKLRSAGIDPGRSPSGAFGDTCPDRAGMIDMAMRAAREHAGCDVVTVVLGDTPLDLAAARACGALAALVATGSFPAQALAALGPDFLAANLEDPSPFLEWLQSLGSAPGVRHPPGA